MRCVVGFRWGSGERSRCGFGSLLPRPGISSVLDPLLRGAYTPAVELGRLEFIVNLALALLATPLAAEAQPTGRVRIGWLSPGSHPFIGAFRQGLRDLGYVEGQTFVIEERYGEGRPERLPDLVVELIRLQVAVIVTSGGWASRTAKNATTSIPIVSVAGDPVASKLVDNFSHPGGNVTGIASLAPDLSLKRLELLKQALPKMSRVAVLLEPRDSGMLRRMEAVAPSLRVRLRPLEARDGDEIDQAFARVTEEQVNAIIPLASPLFAAEKRRIVDLAAKHHLPAMYEDRAFVEVGGLMSYGPDLSDVFRRAATYVDKILKGARPTDLPIEQPTKFELVINLKTAKALGFTIPPSLLLRADEVIQ